MNTDEKLVINILNEISDLEHALERFGCNNLELFLNDSHIKKITTQTLINISESIGYLSINFKSDNNIIDWHQFKSIRNIAAHKYGAINFFIVWQIISINIPAFKKQLNELQKIL